MEKNQVIKEIERKPLTILIPEDVSEAGLQYLIDLGYHIKRGTGIDEKSLINDIRDCEGALIDCAPFISRRVLEAGKRLKVVAKNGVGVDNIDLKAAEALGIWVVNTPASLPRTVAEHTLAMILSLGKKLNQASKALRSGNFSIRNTLDHIDIAGKTLGIIGLGRIGQALAAKAHYGLEMVIMAYDPYVSLSKEMDYVSKTESMEELFSKADFISVHIPMTEENRYMIGEDQFKIMKRSAYFINMARGEVVCQQALIRALEEREIAGAGMDVYAQEPPSPDHPFFTMDNVVATPHNASLTRECKERMITEAGMGIHSVISGKIPQWPVVSPKTI